MVEDPLEGTAGLGHDKATRFCTQRALEGNAYTLFQQVYYTLQAATGAAENMYTACLLTHVCKQARARPQQLQQLTNLEVIRQLCSSSIAWVHCDEYTTGCH